jgi:hypothetical protein
MDDVGFPDGSLKLASALVSEQTDRGIKVRVSNQKVICRGRERVKRSRKGLGSKIRSNHCVEGRIPAALALGFGENSRHRPSST